MIQVFQEKSTALSCSDNTVTVTAPKLYSKLIQPTSHRHIFLPVVLGSDYPGLAAVAGWLAGN
jgi:hypothetical protein